MTMTVMRVTAKNASTPAEREDSAHRVTDTRNWLTADSQLVVGIRTKTVVTTNNTSMISRARTILYL